MNGNAAVYFVDRHIDEGRADKPAFVEVDGAKSVVNFSAAPIAKVRPARICWSENTRMNINKSKWGKRM